MSRGKQHDKPARSPAPAAPQTGPILVRLRPRPRLFVVMCVIFAFWIAGLIALYFTAVHRGR